MAPRYGTPLHAFAAWLVARGAAVESRNAAGETALDRARAGRKGRGAEWLEGMGA